MLAVSSEFLQAIKTKQPQDIRLEFSGGEVITGADIAITSGGLVYTEVLNSATDVTFGRAVMSELSAVLINADSRFTDFDFSQEFTAKVGVCVPTDTFEVLDSWRSEIVVESDSAGNERYYSIGAGKVSCVIMNADYDIVAQYYLRDGANMGAVSMILCASRLYVIDSTSAIVGAFDVAAGTATNEVSPTPTEYPANITKDDVAAWVSTKTCVVVAPAKGTAWEYAPLGVLKGEKPDKVRGKLIEFTAHDRMSLFDKPAESFVSGLTFPCTLSEIFTKLCAFCGVGYVGAAFPNSGKTFDKNPLNDTDYTCRGILAYIAEAAGSYARMSRDGAVELVWFADADYTVTRTDRFEMTESEFLTPPIDKLEVYNSYGDQLNTSGSGDVVYGILDNPFLYIENDTQLAGLQPYVDVIYSRIASLPAYHPSSFRAEFNPAVQCGDVISVVDDYGETIAFPVFVQTITWNGFGKATYENTGGVIRQNAPFTQRELEQLKKKSVKTKDLWGYVDSYLSSEEGISKIKIAVGGEFVTPDELDKYTTTKNLEATVAGYIAPGQASLINALDGKYVSESALKDYIKTTNLASSVTQEIKNGKVRLELSASEDSSTTTEADVGAKYNGEYIGDLDTTLYEFSDKDSEGYYVSQNGGVAYSCSYVRLDFNFSQETDVTFRCVCQGETKFDYGIISNVDCDLGVNYTPDDDGDTINLDIFYSFRDQHSPDPVDVVMTIPAGSHYVTIKYCKDGSTNATGDYFKFRAFTLKTESTSSKSTITLWAGEGASRTEISSADITFKGYVTYESLSTPGATTIDGGNINTDNLHVKKIYMGENYGSNEIMNSNISGNYGMVNIGFIENFMSSSYVQGIGLYANMLFIMPPGESTTSENTIIVDVRNRTITPNATWKLYNTTIMD